MEYNLAEILKFISRINCAIFSGASIYINLVEHPARMICGTKTAVTQWVPSYKRATIMQASLAVTGSISSFLLWLAVSNLYWLTGSILLALIVIYSLVVIRPTNQLLLSDTLDRNSPDAFKLLVRWNRLHMVRSIFGVIALFIFLLVK